jgi:hypothetical protein
MEAVVLPDGSVDPNHSHHALTRLVFELDQQALVAVAGAASGPAHKGGRCRCA